MNAMQKKMRNNSYKLLLLLVLAVMVAVLSVISPYFFSWKNCLNILNQSAIQMILSIGMTFVICSAGIDLSIGALMAFSAVIMSFCLKAGAPSGLSILAGVAAAGVVGLFNGAIVARARVNSFIVTLSMMSILRGGTVLLTDGRPIYGFEASFTFWGSSTILGVGMPVILALTLTAAAWILLERTRFGNYCLFLGSNEKALHRSGINTDKYKMLIFGLSGICAGMAGFIMTARLNSADPLAGSGYEMYAIAAVILGGTLMQGGKGSIGGTVLGCLILNVMKNGLTMLAISSNYQQLLTGLIVLVSVIISEKNRRKKEAAG